MNFPVLPARVLGMGTFCGLRLEGVVRNSQVLTRVSNRKDTHFEGCCLLWTGAMLGEVAYVTNGMT